MNNIYLTPELKDYYMRDFENNILTIRHELWKLDDGLINILIEINKNKNIQTLYSKWWSNSFTSMTSESYLTFCYTKQIELNLFRFVIPELLIRQNNINKSMVSYCFYYPKPNANYHENEPTEIDLLCITDPNYFNINTIQITLSSGYRDAHEKFWMDLNEKLSLIE